MTPYLIVAGIFGLGLLFFMARKAGADERDAKANKEALKDVVEGNRPVSAAESERVLNKYSRD